MNMKQLQALKVLATEKGLKIVTSKEFGDFANSIIGKQCLRDNRG